MTGKLSAERMGFCGPSPSCHHSVLRVISGVMKWFWPEVFLSLTSFVLVASLGLRYIFQVLLNLFLGRLGFFPSCSSESGLLARPLGVSGVRRQIANYPVITGLSCFLPGIPRSCLESLVLSGLRSFPSALPASASVLSPLTHWFALFTLGPTADLDAEKMHF